MGYCERGSRFIVRFRADTAQGQIPIGRSSGAAGSSWNEPQPLTAEAGFQHVEGPSGAAAGQVGRIPYFDLPILGVPEHDDRMIRLLPPEEG